MKKVLVIDDNRFVLRAMEAILQFDFEVTTHHTLVGVQDILESESYDIVILDGNIDSKDKDGEEFARKLQAEGRKVLMISANYQRNTKLDIPFLSKGCSAEEIIDKINELLAE